MIPGLNIRSFKGRDGEIVVPGLGAVIGTFHSWYLFQPEENASGNPKWTLQAVFSFQKDSMLLNDHLDKQITLTLNKDTRIVLCDFEEIEITGVNLTIKGVVQCQ